MSDTDLIDNIVSNETLGIKRKPSLFKTFAVLIVAGCVTFLGYTYYTKSKGEEPPPALNLGQVSTPNEMAAQPTQVAMPEQAPAMPVNVEPDPTNAAVNSENPALVQPTSSSPSNVATGQIVASQLPITQTLPAPATASVAAAVQPSPVAAQPLPAVQEPVAATLTEGEAVVDKPAPVKNKLSVKKPVIKKKAPTPDVEKSDTFAEEGITQEEIIVFQKD